MSRWALVTCVVVVVTAGIGSISAVESDPLGIFAAAVIGLVALIALIVVYVADALIRSSRRADAAVRIEPLAGEGLVEKHGRLVISGSGDLISDEVVHALRDADQR